MKTSVIMTVYNREVEVLLATLRGIWRSATANRKERADDIEVVIANDGSDKVPVELVKEYCAPRFDLTWVDVAPYDAHRVGAEFGSPSRRGHNGPSRAFNEALSRATGERVIVMSSDVIATPSAWKGAMKHDLALGPYSPRVWDIDGVPFREYCGPSRIFPMPWFLVTTRESLLAVGGWDETYLQGLSYDDNDIAGRLCLHAGWFCMDYEATVFHQSHEMLPYRLDIPGMKAAHNRNREWTMQKWGGIPFENERAAFDVLRRPVPSGEIAFQCLAPAEKLVQAVALTTGIHARPTTTA